MQLNSDLSERALVDTTTEVWVPSPAGGVDRIMLDRDGDEVARATSLVRYGAKSLFPEHTHGAGEEFLVLEGVFSDEHGDYPPRTYVRNPPGTAHSPRSDPGCVIFVKLRQFKTGDSVRVVVDTNAGGWQQGPKEGLHVLPLHEFETERVALLRLDPGSSFAEHDHPGGEEFFVLDGVLADEHGSYEKGTWLRNPAGSRHKPFSKTGCTLYIKTGHLQG